MATIVGFPIDLENEETSIDVLNSKSSDELYKMALEMDEALIWDDEKKFLNDLNYDMVDTESMFYFSC